MNETAFPQFMASAPTIVVHDALAGFLGAVDDGIIEYRYVDAVRLAGHSCPTVASAFLMVRRALAHLFHDALPERGGIRVDCRERRDAGVGGVVAGVCTLVTGAAEDGGFHGLGGRFVRRDLLRFAQPIGDECRFTRIDTNDAVEASVHLARVPGDPQLRELMPRCVAGVASDDEASQFRRLWQDRVRRLLLEHANDPEVIVVRPTACAPRATGRSRHAG